MKVDSRKLKRLHAEAAKDKPSGLIEGPSTSQLLASSPKKTFPPPLVFLPGNRTLVEIPGAHLARPPNNPVESAVAAAASATDDNPFIVPNDTEHETSIGGVPLFISSWQIPLDPAISRHRRKRIRQCERWKEVLPFLLDPFLDILRRSESLRNPVPPPALSSCNCASERKTIHVVCVYFQNRSTVSIEICSCHSAPLQLLERGLFGCAPCLPTLAVDLNLLDFCAELFLRTPPNQTVFCSTLEHCLKARGYAMESTDSLRKRFSKSLHWFCALRDAARHHVDNYIVSSSICRAEDNRERAEHVMNVNDRLLNEQSFVERNNSPFEANLSRMESDEPHPESESTPESRHRPSPYLQNRCPLCFGGRSWVHDPDSTIDLAVCLDACFQQKRGQTDSGPPYRHPNSVFLDEKAVKAMEEEVETLRPMRNRRARNAGSVDAARAKSRSLKVSDETLDECEASYKAADERRQKASTRFFSDTGLMALLCRHDRVLWLVNMQSAGEKQYYALALLRALSNNLPDDAVVGVLYDVGCQLHRSIVKWDFLPEFAERMVFGLAVFHAFGHQWACQLVYHPRKCVGFGLTDGEGCERFWSSIKHLISTLRISGSYQRLCLIDAQVQFLSNNNLFKLGAWLFNHTRQCYERLHAAEKEMLKCSISEDELALEWEKQVDEQTKALPRQSKSAARNAVEAICSLRSRSDAVRQRIRVLQRNIANEDLNTNETQKAIKELESTYTRLIKELTTKERALGARDKSKLESLINSPFINNRMNARAVKSRLRSKIQNRKFELQCNERPYSTQKSSSNRKKSELIETQVKRRDPGIVQLAKKYNSLCDSLRKLAREGKAPRDAKCPEPLTIKGLFGMDVDDAIWQDVGLYDDDDGDIPRWLGDENVRKGIKALLEVRRCREELQRLDKERFAMQDWFAETWSQTSKAFESSFPTSGLRYAIDRRRRELLSLHDEWRRRVQTIPFASTLPETWGPTNEDLASFHRLESVARCFPFSSSTGLQTDSDSDNESSRDIEEDGEFLELAEAIESDNVHAVPFDELDFQNYVDEMPLPPDDDIDSPSHDSPSPTKRARIGDVIYSLSNHT
ncbi:hypothetical protein DFH11DRAFT_1511011 [Phellopilus nigrolimitatus]|nr:hypothetical protein DFH11DRAFT_1511011 [Phellopilus nigrolimitatus]